MFADSPIAQGFNLGRSKISYVLPDGFAPLLLKQICDEVRKSNSGFTLMFDETTNAKVEKQMEILIRYCSEKGEMQTKYLTSFMFGRATAEVITDFLLSLMHDKDINLPWEKCFNISSDGPNINKKTWRLLNEELRKTGHPGLLPLFTCNMHVTHNGFHKGILVYGDDCEQLAFDLHAWFKLGHSQRIPILMMRPFSLDMSTPDG